MIKVENVSKVYKINNIDKEILSNVNIRINPGDIFGIVGSTGSGKTTLLKLLNGFIEPDSGVITFEDEILNHTSKKEIVKQTSTIFQEYNLLNNLTVTENVLLPTKFREKEKYNSKEKAFELLDFVKLNDFKTSYIKTLSGGQKQRVAIARSLITNPKVIFCDEPTSALDESMSYEILKLLKDVNEKYNTTIVIVSHNINVIKSLCNKVAILNNGTVEDVLELKETSLSLLNYKEALLND